MRDNKATTVSPRRPRPTGMRPTATRYDKDVLLWSQEQARLLRAGRFDELDIEHLADEIEDVGKSEKRELANRMAVLLAHLLKWQLPARESNQYLAGDDQRPAQADRARYQGDAEPQDGHAQPGLAGGLVARCREPGTQGNGARGGRCSGILPVDDGAGGGRGLLARKLARSPIRPEPRIHCLRKTPRTVRRKGLLAHLRLDRRLACAAACAEVAGLRARKTLASFTPPARPAGSRLESRRSPRATGLLRAR